MKKFTTKLLMSIIAVAFAFVALGTSTYAWFSMNETVTANGMEVGAKSNSTYLLISKTNNTAADIQDENITTVSVAVDNENTLVLPSKPKEASEIGASLNLTGGVYFTSGTAVTTAATAAVEGNWYTATSHDPGEALEFESENDFHSLNNTTDDPYQFSKYVIKKTVYLTLAEGSNDAYHLTVVPTIQLKSGQAQGVTNIDAVKVLVAVGNSVVILDKDSTAADGHLYTADTDNILTDSDVLTADIYIYYDGSEDIVTTNDSVSLAAATISLAFNVTLKPESVGNGN